MEIWQSQRAGRGNRTNHRQVVWNRSEAIRAKARVSFRSRKANRSAVNHMDYNGVTRVDLRPSYFPNDVTTTTIVVQVSGQTSGGTSAAFNVQVDGGVVIGTGTAWLKVSLNPQPAHTPAAENR